MRSHQLKVSGVCADCLMQFRVSMAAIDPDEAPEHEDGIDPSKPRATLKLIRPPPDLDLGESDEEDDDEEEGDSDEEETNGGPSDKEKARKLKEAAVLREMEEDDEEDDDDDDEEFDLQAAISKLVKGKAPATDGDDDDESDEDLDIDEMVVCTLDPEKVKLASQEPLH